MSSEPISLWILGGFLGSGKTTLLNQLLGKMRSQRIGVVVNDFGSLHVDATLVEREQEGGIVELNGGQIFCSCISGNFVKSIKELSRKPIDTIFVESSGLAKPSALETIVGEACRSSEREVNYRGFISVIDAERSPKLLAAVNAVEEQIAYADLAVINKTDLVDSASLDQLREKIEEINSSCSILETREGHIDPASLPERPLDHSGSDSETYAGWGSGGRPKAVTWRPKESLSAAQLVSAVRRVAREAFRIKGYVRTSEGIRFVSASGEQLNINEVAEREDIEEGLSVIVPPRIITSKLFTEALTGAKGE